ncbi:helix-turn-helix domain-containing protein [Egicoccus sp. AB-alg2]|uniref:helix-turn-helix domain-containing protein n=1 Tax=Egicoccus sp. AB-alg2 TaxID=3242693 RepID=UPI00359D49B8
MRQYQVEPITALGRGLQVLKVLHEMRAASLHDLHLATGLPKSTLTRILFTCHQQGFVWQRLADGAFLPSHSLLHRGQLDDTDWLVEVASPVLEDLVTKSRWPSVLSVPRLDYMETLETNSRKAYFDDVRRNPVGYRVNMLRSASGRAYLAFCAATERESVLRRLRQKTTPGHELAHDDAWIERMVRETRARGCSVRDPDFGGDYAGGRDVHDDQRMSIAVPIRSSERVIGCINLTWRRRVLSVERVVEQHRDDLYAAVTEIEGRIRAQAPTVSTSLPGV